jgi:uncharacterized protein (DUF1800 family)
MSLLGRLAAGVLIVGVGPWGGAARASTAHDVALADRLTWGETPAVVSDIARLGPDCWLQQQLRPPADARLPYAVQAQIDAMPISFTPMPKLVVDIDARDKAANKIADPETKKAAKAAFQKDLADLGREAAARSLLRDIYSANQLQEQMTWFWFNHFNVRMQKRDIRAMVGDYEDQAIRPRALGRFRDLLEATLRHPAMLRYLDNDQNAVGHVNENYARELMELHTMGVGGGYTQKDVEELARILTGVGVSLSPTPPNIGPSRQALYIRDGLFEFNPNRHDFGDKRFLGHTIRGRGFGEVEQALDILARQPATAHHVSLRLATFFVGDAPSAALVDSMADTFLRSDGDIAEVLTTLFRSRAFDASLGHRFKDPVHYAVSAVRLSFDNRMIADARPLDRWLTRMAEGLYGHETPDGYPMTQAAWNGPGQLAVRFDIARQIGSGAPMLFQADAGAAATPRVDDGLHDRVAGLALSVATRAVLLQATSRQDWNTLFLSSPEFMRD